MNDTKISKLKWDASKRTQSGRVPQFQWVSDPEVGGLHIRIYPPKLDGRSNKVFYLKYGSSVDRLIYRIGSWGDWTLKEARDEARRLRKGFYDFGIDPNRAKQKRTQDAKARLTVAQLVDQFTAEKEGVWSPKYADNNRLHAKRLKETLGALYGADLHRDDVAGVFLDIKKKSSSQAGLFRTFGRGLYKWALDRKRVPEMANPFVLERGTSSALSEFRLAPTKRARVLRYKMGECGQLFDLLADHDNRSRSDGQEYLTIAKLFLSTAFRNKELREARWEHVDHKLRTLRNVEPKGGKANAYTMPLTDMAYELLESLGEGHIRFRSGPIFPGQARDENGDLEPLGSFERWYGAIKEDPRMPVDEDGNHVTLHDLRRSSITWLQQMRFTVEERTIFKGSKPSGVTEAVYSLADQEDIRLRCAQAIEERIKDVEAGDETSMFDHWWGKKVAGSTS